MRRITAAAVFLCLTGPGMAADHNHPPQDEAIHEQFYSNWYRPDNPAISCCNKQDCAPAEARRVNGQWQARHVGSATWLPIPDAKIELNRDSPDGRNHLCEIGGMVFCFIVGSGG